MIDRDYLFTTLADLIRINSINPTLVPSGKGEAEISDYMAVALGSLGLEVENLNTRAVSFRLVGHTPSAHANGSILVYLKNKAAATRP